MSNCLECKKKLSLTPNISDTDDALFRRLTETLYYQHPISLHPQLVS